MRYTISLPASSYKEKSIEIVPIRVREALKRALQIEKIAMAQLDDFLWIMAQESEGIVDARNRRSTARGLFQLLKAQYHLNPNGEQSFGNAVEECQGGARYIVRRYHTAGAAKRFWQRHHWY